MSELSHFLKTNHAPRIPKPEAGDRKSVAEFSLTDGAIEVPENVPEGDALSFLEKAGQNPNEWEVTGFRRIEYGNPLNPFVSTRFTYKRREGLAEPVPIDDLIAMIHEHEGRERPKRIGEHPLPGAVVAVGDMQIGQVGPSGDIYETVENSLRAIDMAVDEIELHGGAEEILVAWLGDHIEGFASQGGRNAWRTPLTQVEQIRLTRHIMRYAVEMLHPLCHRLVMAAIPGNHGRVETPSGGSTRADDNYDVDALVAVGEALGMSDRYREVEVYVPEADHVSLAVTVGGIAWGLVHGEKWRKGKHFEWWREQAFHDGPTAAADVLLAGHWHHLLVMEEGEKLYIQIPTLGTDGAYWANLHGNRPNPGIVLIFTDGAVVDGIKPLRVRKEQK